MVYYNDLAAEVLVALQTYDWAALLGHNDFRISSRPKTIDTLRQKLRRQPNHTIATINDVAGVRFEARMTLVQQEIVAKAIADAYGQKNDSISDLRETHHSGYRAMHVRLTFPGVGRVEVQVRTYMQGAWANAYERAADVFGRETRYGDIPQDETVRTIVETLQTISTSFIRDYELMESAVMKSREEVDPLVAADLVSPSESKRQKARDAQSKIDAFDKQVIETHQFVVDQLAFLEGVFTRVQLEWELS